MIRYHDVSDGDDDRTAYPGYVDGLVAIGFEPIGRVIAEPVGQTQEELAAYFGPRAQDYLDNATIPTPVLRSPDSTAFVAVAWFFDSPSIRFRTELDDGFLVETQRRWDAPPWDRPDADIDRLMMKDHAPHKDRSVRVVESSECGELWAAHRDHVAEFGAARAAAPERHADLEAFMDLELRTFFRDALYGYDSAEELPAGENVPLPVVIVGARSFPLVGLFLAGLAVVLLVIALFVL